MVEIYDIKPIAHIKLLDNQRKVSCTGDELIDRYYCFAYKYKCELEFNNSFICGSHASKHFLNLLNHEPLNEFNPLKVDGNGRCGTNGTGAMNSKWDSFSKELYNAINILLVYWDKPPSGPILDIKLKLEKYYYKKPFDSTIKSVNTIVKKGASGHTLNEVVQKLKESNDIKEYSFKNIENRLNELNVESFIY
jgi:hypothetical protein